MISGYRDWTDDDEPAAKPKPIPASKVPCSRCPHPMGDHRPVHNGEPFCYVCMDSPCRQPHSMMVAERKAERKAKKSPTISHGRKKPKGREGSPGINKKAVTPHG